LEGGWGKGEETIFPFWKKFPFRWRHSPNLKGKNGRRFEIDILYSFGIHLIGTYSTPKGQGTPTRVSPIYSLPPKREFPISVQIVEKWVEKRRGILPSNF
jgi:hypothetical protein